MFLLQECTDLPKSDALLAVLYDANYLTFTMSISIDGKHAADLRPGEDVHFGLTIGTHGLAATPMDGCMDWQAREDKIHVKAGDAISRRIDGSGIRAVTR